MGESESIQNRKQFELHCTHCLWGCILALWDNVWVQTGLQLYSNLRNDMFEASVYPGSYDLNFVLAD